MNKINHTRWNIVYWVTTLLIATAFFITGVGNILPIAHIANDMTHLGYPPYFLNILGTWKILAAITIVIPSIPRLKEWTYAGMIFDLSGAAFSRYAIGDHASMVIIPLAIASLVVINYLISDLLKKYQIIPANNMERSTT